MEKWNLELSVTEPFSSVGVIKVRQGNKNSEIFTVKVSENGKPYDLTGVDVFFCTRFEPLTTVEKRATVTDAKNGLFEFVMDNDAMQEIGERNAYFELMKDGEFLNSTQNFRYTVTLGIELQNICSESYVERLEDVLNRFDDMKQEIEEFMNQNKEEFQEWFDSVRDILESIDPGGILLNEVVQARHSEVYGAFANLDSRLENIEKSISRYIPKGAHIIAKHNSPTMPKVLLQEYEYGLGVVELGNEPDGFFGGGLISQVACNVSSFENGELRVSIPAIFSDYVFLNRSGNSYVFVKGNYCLRLYIEGGNSTGNAEIRKDEE